MSTKHQTLLDELNRTRSNLDVAERDLEYRAQADKYRLLGLQEDYMSALIELRVYEAMHPRERLNDHGP